MLLNSLFSAVINGGLWYARSGGKILLLLAALSFGLAVVAIACRIFVLPGALRIAAVRYAESAWISFLASSQRESKKGV